MSGVFRLTVVKAKGNATVRTEDFEVPEHRAPIAIGTTPDTPDPPEAVKAAAQKLLKRGEKIGAIVHITPDDPSKAGELMTAAQIEEQIALLQKRLEEAQ